MATNANWRLDPFTNTYITTAIVSESQTVALDSEIGRYGFRLNEAPLIATSGDSLTVVSDPGGVTYDEISFSQAPSAGEYRVDESSAETGFCEFHSSANGLSFLCSYSGKGTIPKPGLITRTESDSSGSFSTTSAVYVDVTNLSITHTASGGLLLIYLAPAGGGLQSKHQISEAAGTTAPYFLAVYRDATELSEYQFGAVIGGATSVLVRYGVGGVQYYDEPAAGQYTYKLMAVSNGSATCSVTNMKLGIIDFGANRS